MTSPFETRALIEGFYGVYYTAPERVSMIRFLAGRGFNLYIYGPKNDRQHRRRWREPYPEKAMRAFAQAVNVARDEGIDFAYTLSPGIDVTYSSPDEFRRIVAKLSAFHALGVRTFGLLLDDIRRTFADPEDGRRFESLAHAQADLCNRVHDYLLRLGDDTRLIMCPTEYHGLPPFDPALETLGRELHPRIGIFYTGRDVCAPTVDVPEAAAFARTVRRRPLLWDNYPVNDLAMQGELHVGPIRGRSPHLGDVLAGVAVNPMNQAEASKIVLATYADYLDDPHGYDPEQSWGRALEEFGGENAAALELVLRNSLFSCLGGGEADRLERAVAGALPRLQSGDVDDPVVADLYDYLRELDESCYELRYRLENLALRNELLPWLEQLEQWTWLGRWSIEALRAPVDAEPALVRRIEEYAGLVDRHHKRIGGSFVRPLARLALERVRRPAAV